MDFIVLLLILWGISGIIKSKKAQESGSDTSDSRESRRQEEQRKREEQRREEIRRRDEERREKQQQEELRRAQQKLSQSNKNRQKSVGNNTNPYGAAGNVQAAAGTYTKEDILTRSSREVNEDFGEDTLRKEAGLHQGCVEGHYEQHSDLLKTVEDLMVLGPNCTISYERDFVGEGERMVETFK